jgi:hypothetical protein
MPSFCDGVETWDEARECPLYSGQKPCYSCKVSQWEDRGSAPGLPPSKRTKPMKGGGSSNAENNGWERGFAYEDRGNGVKAPIFNEKGKPMRMKEFSENRHKVLERRKREIQGLS